MCPKIMQWTLRKVIIIKSKRRERTKEREGHAEMKNKGVIHFW
jgi:ribosomal protein L21